MSRGPALTICNMLIFYLSYRVCSTIKEEPEFSDTVTNATNEGTLDSIIL